MQASLSYGISHDPKSAPPVLASASAGTAAEPSSRSFDTSAVLARLPAAVVLVDPCGTVAMANEAARTLLGPDIVGRPWREVVEAALDRGDPHTVRLRSGRLVEVTTRPQADGRGQIVLLVDVTPSRLAEAFDRRHERLADLGRMIAGIAHQLRTPLATARLQIAALRRDRSSDGSTIAKRIKALQRSHDRLERTIDDMLRFARGDALPTVRLELDAFIDDFLRAAAPRCGASGVRITVERRCRDALVEANAAALAGVLDNLVDNALQAFSRCPTRPVPRIHIAIERLDAGRAVELVGIRISDNGPGIDPSVRPHVFEPFWTGRPDGTGLGLAVARLIVESHGGTIELESPPRGAAFFCRVDPSCGGRILRRALRRPSILACVWT